VRLPRLGNARAAPSADSAVARLRADQERLRVRTMQQRFAAASLAFDRQVRAVLLRRVEEAARRDPRFRPLAARLDRMLVED